LDEDFKCPGYLISQVIQMANQDLANSYQRYPEDLTDNNIHENKAQ